MSRLVEGGVGGECKECAEWRAEIWKANNPKWNNCPYCGKKLPEFPKWAKTELTTEQQINVIKKYRNKNACKHRYVPVTVHNHTEMVCEFCNDSYEK